MPPSSSAPTRTAVSACRRPPGTITPPAGTSPTTSPSSIVNKAAWNSLPDDLKEIVRAAAAACNVISHTWCEATNGEAMADLVQNQGVIAGPYPTPVVDKLREVTATTLQQLADSDPKIKKVYDSFTAFADKHNQWAGLSEAVYQTQIRRGS
ncbi:hypothetical protein ACFSKM_26325 [Ancylobacter dichloromethanicus]